MTRRRLTTYGRLDTAHPEVHEPATVEELRELLLKASSAGRKVTFRGGGYSFDTQSLNDDMVILLHRLNRINGIDRDRRRITVEPGARWGDILRNTSAMGLTPYSMVTTELATAGGTLAADCLSRSTPVYGREGKHIEHLRLLTVAGELLECSRDENAEIFRAVVGGFGYLGVVTEITYNLLEIGDKVRVETVAGKYTSFQRMVDALKEATEEPEDWDAVYGIAFFSGQLNKGFVMRSRHTSTPKLRRMIIYRPKNWLRIPIEWLMRFSAINNIVLNLIYLLSIKQSETYVDTLDGYTFFMDGHRRAKEAAGRLGFTLPTIQQTFVLPEARLLDFLNTASRMLREQRCSPNLFDILYVPSDDFLLSSTNGLAGYAVSMAFDDLSDARVVTLRALLQELSGICHGMGGRVHLVKNVHASTEQLRAMYGDALERFLALKQRLDPQGVLRNDFFDRLFGRVGVVAG